MNRINTHSRTLTRLFGLLLSLLLVACGGGGGSSGGSSSSGDTVNSSPSTKALTDLQAGDCATPENNGTFVNGLAVGDCSTPHNMEVAGRLDFSAIGDPAYAADAEYPGHLAVQQEAYKQCQPVFESWTGVPFWPENWKEAVAGGGTPSTTYDIETITPSASTWADGDRSVICLIVRLDGQQLTERVSG